MSVKNEVIGALIEFFGSDVLTVTGLTLQRLASVRAWEEEEEQFERERVVANNGDTTTITSTTSLTNGTGSGDGRTHEISPASSSTATNVIIPLNGLWIFGFGLWAAGQLSELVALGFGTESSVVAIGNLILVLNAAASVWVFGETFHVFPPKFRGSKSNSCFSRVRRRLVFFAMEWDLVSLLLLTAGSVGTVAFAPLIPKEEQEKFTAEELMKMWLEAPFVYFAAVSLVVLACSSVEFVKRVKRMSRQAAAAAAAAASQHSIATSDEGRENGTTTTTNDNNNNNSNSPPPLLPRDVENNHPSPTAATKPRKQLRIQLEDEGRNFHSATATSDEQEEEERSACPGPSNKDGPLLLALIMAILASLSVTLTKVFTVLITKKKEFLTPESVLLTFAWIITLVLQVFLINVGLTRYEQSSFVPMQESLGTSLTIITGVLYFKSYRDFDSPAHLAGFLLSVLTLLVGLYVMSRKPHLSAEELRERMVLSRLSPVVAFQSTTAATPLSTSSSSSSSHAFPRSASSHLLTASSSEPLLPPHSSLNREA